MPSVAGVGTDIADVARIAKLRQKYGDSFLKKTFTDTEIRYCQDRADADMRFAARFAAKEAMAKALGTGFRDKIGLKSLSVENDESGAPRAVLDDAAKEALEKLGAREMLVSLSHLKDFALAFAVAAR